MSTQRIKPDLGALDRNRAPRVSGSAGKWSGAFAVAATIGLVAAACSTATRDVQDRQTVPVEPAALEGRLLFDVYEGGNGVKLYAMDAAGGPVEDLGVFTDPGSNWSPDGTRILVTSTAGPAESAQPVRPATVASDGSDFRMLDGVDDPAFNLACSVFSPDGSRLACEGYSDLDDAVYTVRASDGGGLRRLTEFGGIPNDYSPDGDEIVFLGEDADAGSTSDEAGTLFVVGTDGTNLGEITEPNSVLAYSYAAWAPDDEWIAFIFADGHLGLVRPDGTEQHAIPFPGADQVAATGGASWLPNGGWIAFSAVHGGEDNPDLYVVRPDGSELQQVTDTPQVAEFTPDWTA